MPSLLRKVSNGGFDVRVRCVIVQPPKPTFLLDEVQDGLANRDLGSLRLYTLGVDVSTAFMSLSHKVTASSSSSSCVVMFVSMLVRLSFSVLCSKSSFVLSNRYCGSVRPGFH